MLNKVHSIERQISPGILMAYNFIRFSEWCVFALSLTLFHDGTRKGAADAEFNMNN